MQQNKQEQEYPTFRTLFHILLLLVLCSYCMVYLLAPQHAIQTPLLLARLKVPESSLSFILDFLFCPRHLGLLAKAWWITLHAPIPPHLHLSMLSLGSFLPGKKSLSPRLFPDLSSPSLQCHRCSLFFWSEIFVVSIGHRASDIYPYFRPIPKMVALQRNPALTFSLNSEPHYFSFLSRLASLEATRRGRSQ